MEINEKDLKLIIEIVLDKLEGTKSDKAISNDSLNRPSSGQDGIFEEVNAAVDAAETAHLELIKLTLRSA